MSYKICFKCDKSLPLSAYYKHKEMLDGHLNKCKECTKNDVRIHRHTNIEKVREYDRRRGYRTSKRLRDAHNRVNRTKKANKCTFCSSTENIELHHPDYDKKTWVVSLCRKCHRNVHAIINIDKQGIKELAMHRY